MNINASVKFVNIYSQSFKKRFVFYFCCPVAFGRPRSSSTLCLQPPWPGAPEAPRQPLQPEQNNNNNRINRFTTPRLFIHSFYDIQMFQTFFK